MALSNFAVNAAKTISALDSSSRTALPGSGATLLVTNLGMSIAFVSLGDSTVVASSSNSIAVLVGQSVPLATGSATHIAAIAPGGSANLNIAQGA